MNLKSVFLKLFGIEKARKRKQDFAEALEIQAKRKKVLEALEMRQRILRLPSKSFSPSELSALPKGSDVDFVTCPIGVMFICVPMPLLPDIIVIGQVVKGNDMFADQWGAGLSIPERGINRYLAKVV